MKVFFFNLRCTAKGSHVGPGGRVAHFIVAKAHQEGIVLCEQYEGKINGDMFLDFIKAHFQGTFSRCRIPKGKNFLQDGKNSKKASHALDTVGAIKFSIPPRSPDFNHIESIFNYVKSELRAQAFEKNINYKTFKQSSISVKHTLENTPIRYIDKTTESMPKRMLMVFKSNERRI